jgi:hypothetical protein
MHCAMKDYGKVDVQLEVFLTTALVGGECSALRLDRYITGQSLRLPLNRKLSGPKGRSEQYGRIVIIYASWSRNPTILLSRP